MPKFEKIYFLTLLISFLVYVIICDDYKINYDDNGIAQDDENYDSDDGELFTNREPLKGNPYTDSDVYMECARNHSNLEDVLNFVHTPFDVVPEHVFCAYFCMAEEIALVLDGDIYPDRLILYPAKRKIFNWTDFIDTKNCLQLLVHHRITTCLEWRDPMQCFSPKLLVDGSCPYVRNPRPLERDPYTQDVEISDDEVLLSSLSEIAAYYQEKTDKDVKIYYVDCAVTFSNITDVRNFHRMPIDDVPEHVFCAFKCMGDAVDLTENGWIEGEISPNRLIMFPALHYEEGYDWDTYNKAEDCLRTLLDAPIKTCWDYKRVMACIPASMFRNDL